MQINRNTPGLSFFLKSALLTLSRSAIEENLNCYIGSFRNPRLSIAISPIRIGSKRDFCYANILLPISITFRRVVTSEKTKGSLSYVSSVIAICDLVIALSQ